MSKGLRTIRSNLYKTGKVLGDLQAVGSGKPSRVAKRVGRRVAGKSLGKLMRKLFR